MSAPGDLPPEVSVEAVGQFLAESTDVDSVGIYLAEAVRLMSVLEAACIQERPEYEPLPRGILSCGEVCRLIPAIIAMALQLHPQLAEPGVLQTILRNAMTTGTTGAVQ